MKKRSRVPQVQSLMRALDILELASQHSEGVSLAEIADHLEVSQGAAFNLASTLVLRRYLHKAVKPVRYMLGDALVDLAFQQAESSIIRKVADGMLALSKKYRDINVLFVAPSAHQVVVKLRMDPTRPGVVQRPMRLVDNPYSLVTSVCLLAFLQEEERVQIMRRYPFDEFAGALYKDKEKFFDLLATVRNQEYLLMADNGRPRLAYPVYGRNAELIGCLGVSMATGYDPKVYTFEELHDHFREIIGSFSTSTLH